MVFLYVVGLVNLVNMLVGFNGLEVGMSVIVLVFLGVFIDGMVRELVFIGIVVVLGFFWWNRYLVRVFFGDIGILSFGVFIGFVVVVGKVEVYGVVFLILYFFDFVIKVVGVRFGVRKYGRIEVLFDGMLKVLFYLSFLGMIMRKVCVNELKLVVIVWVIEFIFGFFVFVLS